MTLSSFSDHKFTDAYFAGRFSGVSRSTKLEMTVCGHKDLFNLGDRQKIRLSPHWTRTLIGSILDTVGLVTSSLGFGWLDWLLDNFLILDKGTCWRGNDFMGKDFRTCFDYLIDWTTVWTKLDYLLGSIASNCYYLSSFSIYYLKAIF